MTSGVDGIIHPTIFLTDEDVAHVTTFTGAIGALRTAYALPQAVGSTPPRAVAATSTGWMRVMPSAPTGTDIAGLKVISAAISQGQVSYLISLFDQQTSTLVAQMDGNHITGLRTAATAAVAIEGMMTTAPRLVAIIGSGFEAREQLRALSSLTEVTRVRVFSPTPSRRDSFAAEMGEELGIQVEAVDTAEAAARGADLIICAARSRDETPTLLNAWVQDGARIVSVGSTTKSQRELDTQILDRAELIVADALEEVVHDSGDMVVAAGQGIDVETKTVSLSDVVTGSVNARSVGGVVVYKSSGSGFQDIVLAAHALDVARAQGVGTRISTGILTIRK